MKDVLLSFWATNSSWLLSLAISIVVCIAIWFFKVKKPQLYATTKDITREIIKTVEKAIPDNTEDKKLKITDNVLKKVIEYTTENGALEKEEITEVIAAIVKQEISGIKKNS